MDDAKHERAPTVVVGPPKDRGWAGLTAEKRRAMALAFVTKMREQAERPPPGSEDTL